MKKSTGPILIVDSSDRDANLRYAVSFRSTDPVVFLRSGSERYLVVSAMELGRARKLNGVRAFTPELLGLRKPLRRWISGWAVGLLRHLNLKSVTVAGNFPVAVARALEKAGVRVAVSKTALFLERQCKTAAELEKLSAAQEAAAAAMRGAVAMIAGSRPGVDGLLRLDGKRLTSARVRSRINEILIARECIGRETIVACGPDAADPHSKGDGPLAAGAAIVIDIFPQHLEHGYWGDITRTVVKGRAPSRLAEMYRAVKAAQALALRHVRAGADAAAIHRRVLKEFARRGFRNETIDGRPSGYIHGTGHGVGLEVHEAPSVSTVPGRLRAGNVVTIEPGLYYPGLGGIRIEDTVVVTRTGFRFLAECEKRFEI